MRMFSLLMALSFCCICWMFFFLFSIPFSSREEWWAKLLRPAFETLGNFVASFSSWFRAKTTEKKSCILTVHFSSLFIEVIVSKFLNGSIISILLLITNEIQHALKMKPKREHCMLQQCTEHRNSVDFSIRQ